MRSLLVIGIALLAGCGSASPSGTGTAAPGATVSPSITAAASTTVPAATTPAGSPTNAPYPEGWTDTFCMAYADIVVAQELARDIHRALDDEAKNDATLLAHELQSTTPAVRTKLAELPDWGGAGDLLVALNTMLDTDDQLVTFYLRYLEQHRDPALNRAHEEETALRDEAVPAVETELAKLALVGVRCPGVNFTLDKP